MYKPFFASLFDDPQLFLVRFIIVVFSICFHENMHARVARKLGDDTAVKLGYAGINPLRQMGVGSLVMLFFIGIAWGKVPVDESRLRGKFAPALVAAAGVIGNIILSLGFILAATLIGRFGRNDDMPALEALFFGGVINLVLAIVNLLPIPGLDGHAIFSNLLPSVFKRQGNFGKFAIFLSIMLVFLLFGQIFSLAEVAAINMVSFFAQVIKWIS